MFPSWYYILFIIVFDSVNVHSNETTDKTHDVNKKHVSGAAAGNGRQMLLNSKREVEDFDEVGDRVLYGDLSMYRGGQRSATQYDLLSDSEDSERDRETSDDNDNNDSSEPDFVTRAVETGDILTPFDLLPIATRFLNKVPNKGEGRGIVSSAKSPEDLSDKLFGAYFITTRRIVHLTEKDLSGLDALQALALEGEAVRMRSSGDSVTEKPEQTFNLNGQWVGLDQEHMRCHYKLIFKKASPSDSVLRKGQSGSIPPFKKILKLEKKLSPNRHLIINHKGRKSNKENNNSKTGVRAENEEEVEKVKKDGEQKKHNLSKKEKKKVKKLKSRQKLKHPQNKRGVASNKKLKKQRKQRKKNSKPRFTEKLKHLRNKNIDPNLLITTTQRPVCKWRYVCRVPGDLDTCRLHTSCFDGQNNNPMLDKKYVDTEGRTNKEQERLVMHFRKMLGLTALDEEVEKIMEQHVMLVKPENLRPDYKIETLDEYFNNIIMAQHASTTPGVDSNQINESNDPRPMGALVSESTPEHLASSREDLRQIVGEKRRSTLLSNVRDPHNFHVRSESTMITTPRYNKRYVM